MHLLSVPKLEPNRSYQVKQSKDDEENEYADADILHSITSGSKNGGRGGIRTPGTIAGSAVFKTAAFDHSATLPNDGEKNRFGTKRQNTKSPGRGGRVCFVMHSWRR